MLASSRQAVCPLGHKGIYNPLTHNDYDIYTLMISMPKNEPLRITTECEGEQIISGGGVLFLVDQTLIVYFLTLCK